MSRFFLAPFAIFVAAVGSMALPALADSITPTVLLATPAAYDGKPVSLAGTVANYKTHETAAGGTIAIYQLCDTACVYVFDGKKPVYKDGDSATADGTFQTEFKGTERSFKNVLIVNNPSGAAGAWIRKTHEGGRI